MSNRLRSWFVVISLIMVVALAACTAQPTAAPGEGEAACQYEAPFTIGVSNSFVGSEWRTQMISNMQEVNEQYKAQGLTTDLVIENADVDLQGQTQQIRNLINRGVDAIIVNPGDAAGLNPVIQEAVDAGIIVISVDQEVSAQGAINVVIDQAEWARMSARWLVEQLGGEGNVVMINGVTGHPANEARVRGATEVFEEAGITILNSVEGMWDEATGQQRMADMLASYPNINGVWAQDGVALGALHAVQAANPDPWPVMVGEARQAYVAEWWNILQEKPDFQSFGVINPPGIGADGLKVAVRLLQCRELRDGLLAGEHGNTIYVPIPGVVDNSNIEQVYQEIGDKPAGFTMDQMLTDEEIDAFFK